MQAALVFFALITISDAAEVWKIMTANLTSVKPGSMTRFQGSTLVQWTWGYLHLYPGVFLNPYGCSSDPAVTYCASCDKIGGSTCDSDAKCQTCSGQCLAFDSVYSADGTLFTGWPGVTFNPLCLPVVEAFEDTWTPANISFTFNVPAGSDYSNTGVSFQISSKWGQFSSLNCDLSKSACARGAGQASVSASITTYPEPRIMTMRIVGTVDQVTQALRDLTFKPNLNLNSKRLRAYHLDPIATRSQPYEIWDVTLGIGECPSGMCGSLGGATLISAGSILVNIWDNNDPPVISDPQDCYFRPGCIGDLRDLRFAAAGAGYTVGDLVVVTCTGKCSTCVASPFAAKVSEVGSAGEILALAVTSYGKGYVSEFPPTLSVQGTGTGAVLLANVGASLYGPCPFPQETRGALGFPSEAASMINCNPEPECSAGSAASGSSGLKTLEYYFGQFWRYEDRTEARAVEGIQIEDVDISEDCSYNVPYCSTMDVTVRAQQGAQIVNRRDALGIYTDTRSEFAWTAAIPPTNYAIKSILYQTELPQYAGPNSAALNYNSQRGGRDEFLLVVAQDQGFTGYDGISQCYKGPENYGMGAGKDLSCGLRVNVTIVAVNDAPTISTPSSTLFLPNENQAFTLSSLGIDDVDVSEVMTSGLAQDDWVSNVQYTPLLNKIKVYLSVTRAYILLSPAARDITVTLNSTQMWFNVDKRNLGHDLCRAQACIADPVTCLKQSSSASIKYQEVCALADETCTTNCQCLLDDAACSKGTAILMYINRTKLERALLYLDLLYAAVETQDMTCGGMPVYSATSSVVGGGTGFLSANPFTVGKKCTSNQDCVPPQLRGCTPGVDCFCCANITHPCSSSADCNSFSLIHNLCGCQQGLVPACGSPERPCYCCNNLDVNCSSDSDCGVNAVGSKLSNFSRCGCRRGEGMCGPFGQGPIGYKGDPTLTFDSDFSLLSGGYPCTYHGANSQKCLSALILQEGTSKPAIISQMQVTGAPELEFFGPLVQINAALAKMVYLTSHPKYPHYNKRYRLPVDQRTSSFNILYDDEDHLTLIVNDMGNSGGTRRRCMLCPQDCSCTNDCSVCTDCGRPYRAGCFTEQSFVVSVTAINDPPDLLGPSEVTVVEGKPYSFINTDHYELVGGILNLIPGPSSITPDAPPDPAQVQFEQACINDATGACTMQPLWSTSNGAWVRKTNGISIVDPDSKDFGYNDRYITLNVSCQHGRLFLNETFLEDVLFDGDTNCDLAYDPQSSELGCRVKLMDYKHPQGNVGLYTRISGLNSIEPYCGSLVSLSRNAFGKILRTPVSPPRRVPVVQESVTTISYGCPCYSSVLFEPTGASSSSSFSHCSSPITINGQSTQESIPLIGNRFIAIKGRLRDVAYALSNLTYLPDPHFNTDVPGNSETITISVNDEGAIGDVTKAADGSLILPPSLSKTKTIKVNIASVNDPPVIGRRIYTTCDARYSDRKMDCPRGPNFSNELFCGASGCKLRNLAYISAWTQMPSWPSRDILLTTYPIMINKTSDYIDVDEDSIFSVSPDVLWITDADSKEAESIFSSACSTTLPGILPLNCELSPICSILCTGGYGTHLVSSYRCVGGPSDGAACVQGTTMCGSGVCTYFKGQLLSSNSNPGEILLVLSVSHGKLSFYPRPPQFPTTLKPSYFALTNSTPYCDPTAGCTSLVNCPVEFDCLFNVSRLWIKTSLANLQQALIDKYISYVSDLNYFGPDALSVFVSDLGYSSGTYQSIQTDSFLLPINVVSINNPPVISATTSVFNYQRGVLCRTSYMDLFSTGGTLCLYPNISRLPPTASGSFVSFSDVDMDVVTPNCPATCGNMTLIIRFGRQNSGALRIGNVVPTTQIYEYFDRQNRRNFVMWGKLRDINMQMKDIFFDTDDQYTGYAPLELMANDMGNYGLCKRDTTCARYDPLTNIQTTTCTRDNRMPCSPPLPGLTSGTLDAVVGAKETCRYPTCLDCNRDRLCGWCPTTCGGKGKCMIGKSKPKFEDCEEGLAFNGTNYSKFYSTNAAYGLCKPVKQDIVLIASLSALFGVAFLISSYLIIAWLTQRHGTLFRYLRKKKWEFFYKGRKYHLLPSEGSSNAHFLFLVVAVFIAGIIASGSMSKTSGPLVFLRSYLLDSQKSISLSLDNCYVRFVPSRKFPAPENQLEAMKIRFSFPKNKDIYLKSDTCSPDSQLEIFNNLPEDVKYLNYWCSVQVIIPDRYVIPSLFINSKGDNVTSIRGGPMDPDTAGLGLDFGPNTFSMQGRFVQARLENVSAKEFIFNVRSGELLAMDLGTLTASVPKATMTSVDADMIVTTRQMTSATVWQKSDNLVCLTAANNSLYVDSNCQDICEFIKPSNVTVAPDPSILQEDSTSPCPNLPTPLVSGCYNPSDCTLVQTQQCFCKPNCEAPYSSLNGLCAEDGTCCHQVCSGATSADLFPIPDQPRCGACVDSINMPWTPGNLVQQWTMVSDKGQISLQSLADPIEAHSSSPLLSVSSYNLSLVPVQEPTVPVDFSETSKINLDSLFHPGGANQPNANWFVLQVTGPGAPESTYASFAWLSHIRYLIVPTWILDFFSLKLLSPVRGLSKLTLKPAFCPGVLPANTPVFNQRIITIYNTLNLAEVIGQYLENDKTKSAEHKEGLDLAKLSKRPEMISRTNFFYFVSEWSMEEGQQLSLFGEWVRLMRDITFIAAPIVFVIYFGWNVKASVLSVKCEYRKDYEVCIAEREPISFATFIFCFLYSLVASLELATHYISPPPIAGGASASESVEVRVRLALRFLFYCLYAAALFVTLALVFICCLWILYGLLIDVPRILPYAIFMACIVLVAWASVSKKIRLRVKAKRLVAERISSFRAKNIHILPMHVVELLISSHLKLSLRQVNLTTYAILCEAILETVLFIGTETFLFLGFLAFTDASITAALLNSSLVIGIAASFLWFVSDNGDHGDTKLVLELLEQRMAQGIERVLKLACSQLEVAMEHLGRGGNIPTNDEDSSNYFSESDSENLGSEDFT
ncbi:hypothetical protein GUITHDRAFT_140819 [Guillardia theta CCMP2712]|uniref:Uncharacterized protein n=1 Tax=Guillardia theta (strain CCMP2712) TaxID=905079 RepID=L1J4E0_GUITC|nr:hypothetical protein GUITHDRAFT_140819 [Guillardia theta CCMP2712]EKX42955.1 hypothetical protein GUITHDRAFT_140819 [Guillardia theta CCMP2712]|eukprot:XP_005829935.1 hypothetical protein GUITHDRAFT_140819 [Guillardia theta CCMP2712]